MSFKIVDLNHKNQELWQSYVLKNPDATFFHRAEWKSVIKDSFGHDSYYLMALNEGDVCGVLPLVHVRSALFGNRLVATAFCVGGGVLADNEDVFVALHDCANELMTQIGADYVEYRAPTNIHESWLNREGLYANFSREIAPDEDDCLKQIPRKQRAVLRKAFANGLTCQHGKDADDFYHLYSLGMRNLGTPVFSKAYIKNLLSAFGDDCDVTTIYHDDKPISSVLTFYFKGAALPYYTGASSASRPLGGADFMYWTLMRASVAKGCRDFDFGRSKVGTGAYSFKKNWGFTPDPLTIGFSMNGDQDMPNVNPNNAKYKYFIKAWKMLPHVVANKIGPHIAKQLG